MNHRGDCERGNEKHGQGLQGKHRGPAEFRADWERRSVYHTALHPPFQPDLAVHGFTDRDTVQGRASCGIRQPEGAAREHVGIKSRDLSFQIRTYLDVEWCPKRNDGRFELALIPWRSRTLCDSRARAQAVSARYRCIEYYWE